jgi:hypothetical protein
VDTKKYRNSIFPHENMKKVGYFSKTEEIFITVFAAQRTQRTQRTQTVKFIFPNAGYR